MALHEFKESAFNASDATARQLAERRKLRVSDEVNSQGEPIMAAWRCEGVCLAVRNLVAMAATLHYDEDWRPNPDSRAVKAAAIEWSRAFYDAAVTVAAQPYARRYRLQGGALEVVRDGIPPIQQEAVQEAVEGAARVLEAYWVIWIQHYASTEDGRGILNDGLPVIGGGRS